MRALILGGTREHSLGRHIAMQFLKNNISPILVGRTAAAIADEPSLAQAQGVVADLMSPTVATDILDQIGDLSDISHLVIAGGGPHMRGSLASHRLNEAKQVWGSIVIGPTEVLMLFHARTSHPYQLVTVASTSAKKLRSDETIYASAQAARRAVALNFHDELMERAGATSNLIVCPGGMKTNLWAGTDMDTSSFMDPHEVAVIIGQAMKRCKLFCELTIDRGRDGIPMPEYTYLLG